jgi:hypothetical protein
MCQVEASLRLNCVVSIGETPFSATTNEALVAVTVRCKQSPLPMPTDRDDASGDEKTKKIRSSLG